jgi:inorganic pyrophosphatase
MTPEEREAMDLIALGKTNGRALRRPVLEVVIETPGGCRNKFTYDEHVGVFRLHKILPVGFKFPFDFGFVPGTLAADGDPLDVLIVGDEPTFTGCVMSVRLLGVLVAEQTEGHKTIRNDRLIATPESAKIPATARTLDDLPPRMLEQIQHFFIAYNRYENREFKIVKRQGAAAAVKLVAEGRRKHRQSKNTQR